MTDTPQPILDHLIELRQRLIYSLVGFFAVFCVCYYYSETIFQFLVQPLEDLLKNKGARRLIYTGLTEAFLTYIKVAAYSAAFLSFPLVASQVWRFMAPGLYRDEKKIFLGLLAATPVLFFAGALFAYYVVFPAAYSFFLSFETVGANGHLPIELEAKVNEYLSFVIRLVFAFGASFELPVVLTLLASIGALSSSTLLSKWRIAVVAIFAVAALITPPDMLSMIGLAIPLIVLYGLSILMVRFVERRYQKKKDSDLCMTSN